MAQGGGGALSGMGDGPTQPAGQEPRPQLATKTDLVSSRVSTLLIVPILSL